MAQLHTLASCPHQRSPLVTTKLLLGVGIRWKVWLNFSGMFSPSGCTYTTHVERQVVARARTPRPDRSDNCTAFLP